MPIDLGSARRILIVRLSALGDVVHVLPLLDALRRARPDVHIGWLVEEASSSLLADHPQIDRVWVAPRRETEQLLRRGRVVSAALPWVRSLRALRAARYEVSIDTQCNLRSSLLAWLSGAPRRIGFAPPFTKELAHWLLTDRVAPPSRKQLKVERNLELLRPFAIDGRGARAQLTVPAAARAAALDHRAQFGAIPVVALHPGVSGFGDFKRWPTERYASLARHLHAARGAHCIVTWGPGERDLAEAIVGDAGGAASVAPETTSILDLAALFECCDVVLGGDTGPVHLAAALGVPVVGLYGPKDPAIYAPWDGRTGEAAATIWKRVHCSPCGLRRCDNVICMPAIEVEDAVAAVGAVLREDPVASAVAAAPTGNQTPREAVRARQ
jgi:lipopolysaccharide heptosyltransferase I